MKPASVQENGAKEPDAFLTNLKPFLVKGGSASNVCPSGEAWPEDAAS